MYQYELNFILIGLDALFFDILNDMKPLAGFSHKINVYKKVSDIKEESAGINDIVITNDEGVMRLKDKFSPKTKYILVEKDPKTVKNTEGWTDIWNVGVNKDIIKFKLAKLISDIKAEKDAWFTDQYFENLIAMIPDLVWVKDLDGRHLNVNAAFCEAVGKDRDDVRGKYHRYIWGKGGKEEREGERICKESEMAIVRARKALRSDEMIKHSKKGHRELSVIKTPVFDENDVVVGTIGFAHDITKEKEDQKNILQLAYTDALTGLSNRRYFYQRIEEERGAQGLTICYIDLDHFKQLNDTYGHNAGDGAILGVAELLRVVFAKDLTTRMGGDEFAVGVIGELTKKEMDERIVYLEKKGREMFESEVSMKNLSMSIGISSVGSDKSLETLLIEGDNALYYSKEHGRARHTFFDDMQA